MKKLVFKIGLLFLSIVLILITLDHTFKPYTSFQKTVNAFYDFEGKNESILFLGSSHVYSSCNPEIIDVKTGTPSFVFASPLQNIQTSKFLLKEFIAIKKPKLIVLDLFVSSFSDLKESPERKDYNVKAVKAFNFSWNKVSTLFSYYSYDEVLTKMLYTIENHNNWSQLINSDYYDKNEFEKTFFYKGFYSNGDILKTNKELFDNENVLNDAISIGNKTIVNNKLKYLDEIIKLCNENDIELLITNIPYTSSDKNDVSLNNYVLLKLKKLTEIKNINFLDKREFINKLKLNKGDYRDFGHLNEYGARKVSNFLSSYIIENYNLQKSSSEPHTLKKSRRYHIENDLRETDVQFSIRNGFTKGFKVNKIGYLYRGDNQHTFFIKLEGDIKVRKFRGIQLRLKLRLLKEEKEKLANKNNKSPYVYIDKSPIVFNYNNSTYLSLSFRANITEIKNAEFQFLKQRKAIGKTIKVNNIDVDKYIFKGSNNEVISGLKNKEQISVIVSKKERQIKHGFLKELNITNTRFYTNKYKNFILLQTNEKILPETIKNKSFAIHTVANEVDFDKLPKRLKDKNSLKIISKSTIEVLEIDGKPFILLSYEKECNINNFDLVTLFLVDSDKYRGVIGNILKIENVQFNNK